MMQRNREQEEEEEEDQQQQQQQQQEEVHTAKAVAPRSVVALKSSLANVSCSLHALQTLDAGIEAGRQCDYRHHRGQPRHARTVHA